MEKPWAYTLYQIEERGFVLSVLCGDVAMYQLNIPLDQETGSKAIADDIFLEEYANDVRDNPARYADRCIKI
jgi:hypothetical protein